MCVRLPATGRAPPKCRNELGRRSSAPPEYAALTPVKAFCERSLRERQYYPKFAISSIDPASHKSHLVFRSENDCNEWITKQRPGFIRADWRINTKAGRVCDLPHTSDLWDMIGYCADLQQRLLVPPKKKEKNKKLCVTTVRKICAAGISCFSFVVSFWGGEYGSGQVRSGQVRSGQVIV